MVSNVLGMTSADLETKLAEFREQYKDDPEWQEIRAGFPEDWPF
jgi:hypothetical protein